MVHANAVSKIEELRWHVSVAAISRRVYVNPASIMLVFSSNIVTSANKMDEIGADDAVKQTKSAFTWKLEVIQLHQDL